MTEVSEKAVLASGGLYHIFGRKTFSNLTATALSVEGEKLQFVFNFFFSLLICSTVVALLWTKSDYYLQTWNK